MRRNGLIAIAIGVAIAGVVGVVSHGYLSVTRTPAVESETIINIPKGYSFANILDALRQQDIRFNRFYVQVYAEWRDISRRLQAGVYAIPARATIADILKRLVAGDVLEYPFTVVEGWSLRQTMAAMEKSEHITIETDDVNEIAEQLGLNTPIEGWVRPRTYYFAPHTGNVELLRRGYASTRELLNDLWATRPPNFPLKTPYEALILASMLEKESHVEDELPRIAGVFLRRLERNMRLQSDPTVIYGLGERFTGRLRKADLRFDTPYNTYLHKGLPPTPIAMPSDRALRAVFNPRNETVLYFVAKGDGTHYFSSTYEEHREAVRRYIK